MTKLGQKIADARRRRGLSLREASRLTGLSYQSIANAERGAVHPETAVKIGSALSLPPSTVARLVASDLIARTG